jgi:hypothetical protein
VPLGVFAETFSSCILTNTYFTVLKFFVELKVQKRRAAMSDVYEADTYVHVHSFASQPLFIVVIETIISPQSNPIKSAWLQSSSQLFIVSSRIGACMYAHDHFNGGSSLRRILLFRIHTNGKQSRKYILWDVSVWHSSQARGLEKT